MTKKNKTLQDASLELKRSINRLHESRVNFLRAYQDSLRLDRYEGDSYFQSKFSDKVDGGYRQSM